MSHPSHQRCCKRRVCSNPVRGTVGWSASAFMKPQLDVLWSIRAAICGGDTEFVYALDGIGTIGWGYPRSAVDNSRLNISNFVEDGSWWLEPDEILTSQEHTINGILQGHGNPRRNCPVHECYVGVPPTPIAIVPGAKNQALRPSCCAAFQTKVPDLAGGRFSLTKKHEETVSEASDLWNPGCADTLNVVAYYVNLLQNSIGEEIRRIEFVRGGLEPCGGNHHPDLPEPWA